MLDKITDALVDISEGRMVVVVDDEDRENEGDLIQAAQRVTPESINFMATHGKGMICLALTEERAEQLNFPPMVSHNTALKGTGFTVTIDYVHGTTTGISAEDRAATVKAIVNPASQPCDFARPGHIHPIRAKAGGVLERMGQTEAAVDLARLAGLFPAGVLCEVMREDGTMMRRPELRQFADRHGLKMISVAELIKHRTRHERFVQERVRVEFPTKFGTYTLVHFEDIYEKKDHLAIVKGPIPLGKPTLVRAHSECLTGDVLGSARCDCGLQLEMALRRIEEDGAGVVVYLRQEGRGIGLGAKLQAYKLQDEGMDTVEANLHLGYHPDLRRYGACAQILKDLGTDEIRLMTNNPRKVEELESHGIKVVERVPLQVSPTEMNLRYLQTKRDKLGHMIDVKA